MDRLDRGPRHPQAAGDVLHVRLAPDGVEPQRQRLQHGDLAQRALVRVEDLRRQRLQHVRVADDVHPALRGRGDLHGRPLGVLEPDAVYVRLAAPDILGDHRDHEERGELDAERGSVADGGGAQSCSGCSGGSSVGYIGGSTGGSVTFSRVTSSASTKSSIRIKYLNGDSSQRFATVTVNGVSQKIAFLPTDSGTPGSSVLNVNLNSGSSNTVVITTTDGTYGPDVDRIMVPNS